MTHADTPFLSALHEAKAALATAQTAEPGEATVARRLTRDLDQAIARASGSEVDRDLISIMCHDLKDPLASIVMGAGFLRKTALMQDPAARRVVEAIARSAERMNRVVGDFHDLAKLEVGALFVDTHPCDIGAALQGVVGSLEAQARERELRLRLEPPVEPAIASCDRARLGQLVGHLVSNALRFTPAGGEIVVTVQRDGARVRVSVRDTGRGIPPERLGDIFDRAANARRVPRDGPGLGLALVRGLVELQGGDVSVESHVNEGSVFSFTLPAVVKA